MKKILLLMMTVPVRLFIAAQELPPVAEQQLENSAATEEIETEDDSYLQLLAAFSNNPLNLNEAGEKEMEQLQILSALQISQFLQYRHLFGKIVDKYELQAVPGWDLVTIQKLMPFICINTSTPVAEDMHARFARGQHSLLLRYSQQLESANEYDHSTPGTKYQGDPSHIFFRYRYSYKNLLQFGITGDKDAGESFLSGAQKMGFDFYSFHFFMSRKGIIQSLALGDFMVNMGQGLIQWQSMAFKKGADVMAIKRQSPVIRPYNSAGEFNFHRGAGITLQKGKWEATVFCSFRKLSANLTYDSISKRNYFSSFQASGYHRTASEIGDKNDVTQSACGNSIKYRQGKLETGINCIGYKFSAGMQKRDEPYNLYSILGDHWFNASTDYSYTCRNVHLFGEVAIDQNAHKAFVNGLLMSIDPAVDISLLYRNLGAAYQSINANTFTESTFPTNEKGMYMGIIARPASCWQVAAYADVYRFPWLRYQVDAPANGKDFLLQVSYTPNRQVEIYTRYKSESKQGNQANAILAMDQLVFLTRQNWRTQFNYRINPDLGLRSRIELVWYDRKKEDPQTGFLMYVDGVYKPLQKPYSVIARLAYFETTGYDARVYAYENDVLYSYAVPALSGKGYRYYILFNHDINRSVSCWIRWSQFIIKENMKSELKLQVRLVMPYHIH